jgi:hypothetical protein
MGSALHLAHTFGTLWGALQVVWDLVAGWEPIQALLSTAILHP